MLITGLINFTYSVLNTIISWFPTGSGFSSEVHSAFQTLGGYLHILDPLVPVAVLLSCVTLIFTVEIAVFGFKTFKWLFSHIPFIGGKGK